MSKRYDVVAIDPSLTGLAIVCAKAGEEAAYQEFSSKAVKTLANRVLRFSLLSLKVELLL
jgi:hypothetical protein